MHVLAIILFGGVAAFWIFQTFRVAFGALKLPWLKDFDPILDGAAPRVSLIFAARDEEEKLPAALETLAKIDYPELEIIGVDDRSDDATARILDEFAARHARFRAIHVAELPDGWLGKPHALQKGYEAASGEWLLFTDADVRFQPDALRQAMAVALGRKLDHLSLLGQVDMVGFWETVLITFFGMAFHLSTNPSGVTNSKSSAYMGVGAFQMLKRTAYEKSGGHRRLAMEVIDDMKLGKIVKEAGFRSGVGIAQEAVAVRWQAGAGNLIRGVTKNFFAGAGFSVTRVIFAIAGLLLMNVAPFFGVAFGHGWVRELAAVGMVMALALHCGVDVVLRSSPVYCLTLPLGAVLFAYMLLRSMVVTLRQGGIIWRGTFYPLAALRRGAV